MNKSPFSFTVTQWHQKCTLTSQTKASCATSAGVCVCVCVRACMRCVCVCVCVCVWCVCVCVWGGSIHSAYSLYTQCQTGSQTVVLKLFSFLPLPFLEFVLKYPRLHFSLSLFLFMTVCFQSLNGLWGRPVSRRYWATVFRKEFRALSKCAYIYIYI